jgi:hypothetical protein
MVRLLRAVFFVAVTLTLSWGVLGCISSQPTEKDKMGKDKMQDTMGPGDKMQEKMGDKMQDKMGSGDKMQDKMGDKMSAGDKMQDKMGTDKK